MKHIIFILFFGFQIVNGISQQIGAGIFYGAEASRFVFSNVYQFSTEEKIVGFNQLGMYHIARGGFNLNYQSPQKWKYQLEIAATADPFDGYRNPTYAVKLGSSDQFIKIFADEQSSEIRTPVRLFQSISFKNKIAFNFMEFKRVKSSAFVVLNYIHVLNNRMERSVDSLVVEFEPNSNNPPIYLTEIGVNIQEDFVKNQFKEMNDFLCVDLGLEVAYNKFSLGFSTGLNVTTLGKNNILGRFYHAEMNLGVSIFSYHLKKQRALNLTEKSNESKVFNFNNSNGILYLRAGFPLNISLQFNGNGIYSVQYSDYFSIETPAADNYGLVGSNYEIFHILNKPKISLMPMFGFGISKRLSKKILMNAELHATVVIMEFENVLFTKGVALENTINEDADDLKLYTNDFEMNSLQSSFTLSSSYLFSSFKRFNLWISPGLRTDWNLMRDPNNYNYNILAVNTRQLFCPNPINIAGLIRIGVERNAWSLEFEYAHGIFNYYPVSLTSLGKMSSMALSAKIPVFRFGKL